MPVHFAAWTTTLKKYGIAFSEQHFYALGGVPVFEIIKILADAAGKTLDVRAVAGEKEKRFIEHIHQTKAVESVVEIARINRRKLPLAVASGTGARVLEIELKHLGIFHWFDAIVGSDAVQNHKPAPDVFLKAARQIGVDPTKCCAFEDSDIGLQAARAAGMDVVDVRELI